MSEVALSDLQDATSIINEALVHVFDLQLSEPSRQRIKAGDLSPLLNWQEDALRFLKKRQEQGAPIRLSIHDLLKGL